ncbi:MAG: hypothetical protein ACTSUO_04170 [Candidatus Thorarchaeota archaeon]
MLFGLSAYLKNTNSIEDNKWISDRIKHNLSKIQKKVQDLTETEKLVISAMIKLKSKNEDTKIKPIITHLTEESGKWIAYLYDIDSGCSLFKE